MIAWMVGLALCAAPENVAQRPVFKALRAEVARAKEQLSLPGMDKPYFLSLTVEDEAGFSMVASYGALDRDDHHRYRRLRAQVRVGSPESDNGNFLGAHVFSQGRVHLVAYEDDVDALRREAWLAIDDAYKEALESLAQKRAALKTHENPESHDKDFAPTPVARVYAEGRPPALATEGSADRLRRLSGAFKAFAELQNSRAELAGATDEVYRVDSEGSESYESQAVVRLRLVAQAQAEDGMHVGLSSDFWGEKLADLPDDPTLGAAAAELAHQVISLRTAPIADDYTGPVLFEGRAAPQLVLEVLANRLGGTPPPLAQDPRFSARFPDTDLAHRIGTKLLPPSITVEDDPLQRREGAVPLIGAYPVDDEGVPARKVTVVKDGVLKELLMSRTPREGFPSSNGHGRTFGSGDPQGSPAVIILRAKSGLDAKALRKRLLDLAKDEGLPYGYLVRSLSEGAERRADEISSFIGGVGEAQQSAPALLYRLYPTGKEELVRGARIRSLPLRALREIAAAGNAPVAFNTLGRAGRWSPSSAGREAPGLSGLPLSSVAPSLLFTAIELSHGRSGEERPPYLVHP